MINENGVYFNNIIIFGTRHSQNRSRINHAVHDIFNSFLL